MGKGLDQKLYFQSMYFYDIEVDRNVIILARDIKNYYFIPGDPAKSRHLQDA
jgi:hypothetical protein